MNSLPGIHLLHLVQESSAVAVFGSCKLARASFIDCRKVLSDLEDTVAFQDKEPGVAIGSTVATALLAAFWAWLLVVD